MSISDLHRDFFPTSPASGKDPGEDISLEDGDVDDSLDLPLQKSWEKRTATLAPELTSEERERIARLSRLADGEEPLPYALGQELGAWRLEGVLGRGGQAVVFRARHAHLQRTTAIKVPVGAQGDRLVREACALAELRHAHIVAVEDLVLSAERPYMVLEHLPDGSLADHLQRHPQGLPPDEVRTIALQVLAALEHAHGLGVVHRDLKPANVLRSGETWKVADFGIGKAIPHLEHSLGAATLTGAVGTPLYLAPEQQCGGPIDGRADLFALGKLLYQMLTGGTPSTIHPLPADLHPAWQKLVFELVEEEPRLRPASAEAVAQVIRSIEPKPRPVPAKAARAGVPEVGRREEIPPPDPESAPVVGILAATLGFGTCAAIPSYTDAFPVGFLLLVVGGLLIGRWVVLRLMRAHEHLRVARPATAHPLASILVGTAMACGGVWLYAVSDVPSKFFTAQAACLGLSLAAFGGATFLWALTDAIFRRRIRSKLWLEAGLALLAASGATLAASLIVPYPSLPWLIVATAVTPLALGWSCLEWARLSLPHPPSSGRRGD